MAAFRKKFALGGWLESPFRNLIVGLIYMAVVMAAATAAYVAAGWSLADAVYMVVLTVYTVGYDEVHAIDTPTLRAITIALIILGCTGMIFLTGVLVQLITFNQLQQFFGQRRMQNQIDRLNQHVIVCGYGRIGLMLARELKAGQAQFVILERRDTLLEEARDNGYLCVHGDATDEAALIAAGVQRARCLASVLPDDAANVFITLSARSLNRDLVIISRGEVPSTESKLLQAGADRVILPTHIGAERIAELIMYPEAARVLHGGGLPEEFERSLRQLGLEVEVVPAAPGSRCIGQTIEAVEQAAAGAFLIVGLDRGADKGLSRPAGDVVVQAGDGVVVMGRPGRARTIASLFDPAQNRQPGG